MIQTLRTLANDLSNAGHAIPARDVYNAVIELMNGDTDAAHYALTAAYDAAGNVWKSEIWNVSDALRRHTHTATVRRATGATLQAIAEKYPADSATVTATALHDYIEAALQAIEAADNDDEAAAHSWTAGYLLGALTALTADLDMFEYSDPAEQAAQARLQEACNAAQDALSAVRFGE